MNDQTIAHPAAAAAETDRTGLSRDALRRAFLDNLFYMQGKFPALATQHDYYHGAGLYGARPPAAALDQHRGGLHPAGARARWPTCRPSS